MILDKLKGFGMELPRHPACMQDDWSLPFMRWVVAETTSGMEAALGTEDPPGVILSTHRDIVCDPALYNLARVEAGARIFFGGDKAVDVAGGCGGEPRAQRLFVVLLLPPRRRASGAV